MSLRRQLIALFAALAVLPLLLVGLLDYIRSIHALEDVIASNTAVIAEQAAAELQDRFSGPAANLALLAENTAAVAILDGVTRARRAPDSTSLAYLRRLRDVTRKQFAWIVYRDSASSPIASFDDEAGSGGYGDNLYIASLPVRDARGGAIGRVDAAIRMDSIYPRTALDVRFGRGGRTAVLDMATAVGALDHREFHAVFVRAGGAQVLELHEDARRAVGNDVRELDQRRVADGAEGRGG